MTFFSEGIEAEYTKSNTSCFSRLATSLSDTYFHLAACGDSIASFELVRNSYHFLIRTVLEKGFLVAKAYSRRTSIA